MSIEIPRHVHRDQSSCLVETWEGLRQAESEGWRVNPNEPDTVYALESVAAAEPEPDAAEGDDSAAVSEDAPEPAQDGAGEAEPATDEAEADDKPKRGRGGKKR